MKWKLFPTNALLFKWREPEAFRVAQDRRAAQTTKWWHKPGALIVIVSIYLASWFVARLDPHKTPASFPVAFGSCLGLGIFLVYLLPWLLRRAPATVELRTNRVIKMGQQTGIFYRELVNYTWLQEETYHVLDLETRKGRHLLLGVPDAGTRDEIDAILRLKIVRKDSDLGVKVK